MFVRCPVPDASKNVGHFLFNRLKTDNMEATFQLTPETLAKMGPFFAVNKSVFHSYGLVQATVLAELVFMRYKAQKSGNTKQGWFRVTDKHMKAELHLSSYKTNKSLNDWQKTGIVTTQIKHDGSRWVYVDDEIAAQVLGEGAYTLTMDDGEKVVWPPKQDEKNLNANPKNLDSESKKFGNHNICKKEEERVPHILFASELYERVKKQFDESGGKMGVSYTFFKALMELNPDYIWQPDDGKALNECVWMAKKRIQNARKQQGHINPFATDREAYNKLADMVRNLPDFYLDKFDTNLLRKKFNEFANLIK